jgi:hypothetical protein
VQPKVTGDIEVSLTATLSSAGAIWLYQGRMALGCAIYSNWAVAPVGVSVGDWKCPVLMVSCPFDSGCPRGYEIASWYGFDLHF